MNGFSKKTLAAGFAIMLAFGAAFGQTSTTAYKSQSGDAAVLILTSNGTVSVGSITFTDGGQQHYIVSQASHYITGGVSIDYEKMSRLMMSGGFVNPNDYMKSEPMKFIHTDFAASGYRARLHNQDSPRDGQLDITLPSGKTMTFNYNRELTNMANSPSSQPAYQPDTYNQPNSQSGNQSGNAKQCYCSASQANTYSSVYDSQSGRLMNMKYNYQSYSDSERRNIQNDMRRTREEAIRNCGCAGIPFPKSSWEDWDGRK